MLFCLFFGGVARSATFTWANTNGGDWNIATNWIPAQVPASGDDAVITNAGTYTVTNNNSVTLGSLILGGTNGIQTLSLVSLTLTNTSMVNSNGVLNWSGGDLENSLTILQGGTLSLSNTIEFAFNNAQLGQTNTVALTNYGTVVWAGNATSYGNNRQPPSSGGSVIYNAGLWQAAGDNTLAVSENSSNLFVNVGTLEKTGGTGTSTINWSFNSTGTIVTPSGSFTLNWSGANTLSGNLTLAGSTIATPLTVASNAVLNLSGDDLEGALTVAQGGTLSLSNNVSFTINNANLSVTNTSFLTNYGTVVWAGNATSYGNNHQPPNSGGSIIYNAGLWQAAGDNTFNVSENSSNLFVNVGTLEKTGGTGTSTINWSFDSEGGTLDTFTGSFNIGNWIGIGLVHGSATLLGGTISGTLASDAQFNFSATINGSFTILSNAVANWNGGDLEGAVTVAQGGTLSLSNSVSFTINNANLGQTNTVALTNYGTVFWAGNVTSYGNNHQPPNSGGSIIYNAGLWQAAGDNTFNVSENSSNLFVNVGTLDKTGGTGTSTINWSFNSTGTIITPSGSFTLNWSGANTLNGNLTLAGSTIATPLTVASNAVLNLSGGDLENSLTILQGGTLSLSNSVSFAINNANFGQTNNVALTNYGTVFWAANATSYGNNHQPPNSGGSVIYNAGLWQAVGDNTLSVSENSSNLFVNVGTLDKTGGTGTSTINWNFESEGGTLATPVGFFTFSSWDDNNLVRGNASVSGNISGMIASNAVINWIGGDLEGALTVAQSGTLSISNTIEFAFNNAEFGQTNNVALTNYGTVFWAGNVTSYGNNHQPPDSGGSVIYNAGLWQAAGDNTLSQSENSSNLFVNVGTLEKTGGISTSTINWSFLNDGGILGSQTNTLSLAGNYDLTGGTLNFGINSLAGFGKIQLSGSPAALAGSVSANLNNGYVPATGSSFPVLTYSSKSGTFTNFNLPFPVAWQTNYGGTVFTLTVLNVRPTLNAISSQNLDEQTTLNVNATATDPDSGQSLTYTLVSGPGGLNVSPGGAISWTPNESQGPSSNVVFMQVTDNGTPALSATNSFVVTVNEINVPPQLTVPPNQIVNEQTTLNVSASATDSDIPANPLTFALVSPPVGMTIDTNTGAISWTPTEAQGPGIYTVTVVVTDLNTNAINQQSFSVTNSFMVAVNEVNVAPVLTLPANTNINELVAYSANATATDSDIPANPLTFALVSGPSGFMVSPGGAISWTPTEAQGPSTNTVTISVTDTNPPAVNSTSLSVTNSYQIIVNEVNSAPVLGALTDWNVNPGFIISFTATATDSDLPTNTLAFTLVSPPAGATINNGSGQFNWRPTTAQAGTTNTVQVQVTDNGVPPLSDTKSFRVIVNPLAPVVLTPIGYTNGQFTLSVNGTIGPDYIISTSTNLTQWSDLLTNLSSATPFQFNHTNPGSFPSHFYRARLSP